MKSKRSHRAPLISIKVEEPWELVGIDVAGPLKETKAGNKHIILVIDSFSKYLIAKATKNFTGETTTKFVKEELISKYGVPKALLSDQGRNFESNQFEQFCKDSGIKKVRTTSYHPQCNGMTERTIRTIKKMLSCYVNEDHDNWDEILAEVVFAYNNSEHSSTGFAPNQVIFGRILESPNDRKLNVRLAELNRPRMDTSVLDYMRKAQEKQKKQNDKQVNKIIEFKINDFILLENTRQVVGHVRAFEPKFRGPYIVLTKSDDVNYVIKEVETNKTLKVHVNRMHHYVQRVEN